MQTNLNNSKNASVRLYNEDCITGAPKHILSKSVDLIICDPPFGINEGRFSNQYNRTGIGIVSGYCEAPSGYFDFTREWLGEAKRVLQDNGSMYIVSGWSQLHHVLNAITHHDLYVINHLIWKYNFGVFTRNKYVSSHYHILFLKKNHRVKHQFNTVCRFESCQRNELGGSAQYKDLEDVWSIKKEYQRGRTKNINKLPDELVRKMIQYSSLPGETVGDFFMGNFTTARVAIEMRRKVVGFEKNSHAYNEFVPALINANINHLAMEVK